MERNIDDIKIGIYSANFGNYRDELNISIDNYIFEKNVDYFFFTDNKNLKLNHWKIIITELKEELDFIKNIRHTSKHVKFVIPEILKSYDIIIWIDTKKSSLNKLINIKRNKIINLMEKNKNNILVIKNPFRKCCKKELEVTMKDRRKLESKENGTIFLNKIKNISFNSTLPDTTCLIYENNKENITILKDVYDTLIENKLRRDQNVIQYVFYKNNCESKLKIFNWQSITKI